MSLCPCCHGYVLVRGRPFTFTDEQQALLEMALDAMKERWMRMPVEKIEDEAADAVARRVAQMGRLAMKTYDFEGRKFVQGEPIPEGTVLSKDTLVLAVWSAERCGREPYTFLAYDGGWAFKADCFYAVPVPTPPDGCEIADWMEPHVGDFCQDEDGTFGWDETDELHPHPRRGRKCFILRKKEQEPRCPGCGDSYKDGLHAEACPWVICYRQHATASGYPMHDVPTSEAYADAHWREHWQPKVGDWVVDELTNRASKIKRVNEGTISTESGIVGPETAYRPATPAEIAAAQGIMKISQITTDDFAATLAQEKSEPERSEQPPAHDAESVRSVPAPDQTGAGVCPKQASPANKGESETLPAPVASGPYTQPAFPLAPDKWPALPYSCGPKHERPSAKMAAEKSYQLAIERIEQEESLVTAWDRKGIVARQDKEDDEAQERAEYERLRKKYEGR